MSVDLLFVLLIILAYFGVTIVFRRKNIGLLSGMEYLMAGKLLSLTRTDVSQLSPLLYSFIGWVGMLTGSQLRLKYLLQLEKRFYVSVLLYVVSTFMSIALLLLLLFPVPYAVISAIALTPICYITAANIIKSDRYALLMVSFLPVICILFYLVYNILAVKWIVLYLIIFFSASFAIISRFIITHIDDRFSVSLILIGLILLISESCAVAGISPLLVGFWVGAYLANFCPLREDIFSALFQGEKPLYALFLLLVGMLSGFELSEAVILNIGAVFAVVLVVKSVILRIGPLSSRGLRPLCFVAPGGFAIAIGVDFWLFQEGGQPAVWFTSFLAAVMILQFLSVSIGRYLEKKN